MSSDFEQFSKTMDPLLPGTQDIRLDATIRVEHHTPEEPRNWRATLPHLSIHADHDGDIKGDLSVIGRLGEGGMGVVDLAHQRSLQRHVAIKRLKRTSRGSSDALEAMLHEARYTGTLEHPNIIPVHALGIDEDGQPVLVMKRVEGASWQDMLHDADHPGWDNVPGNRLVWHMGVLSQVCNAVHFAHSRRIIHRDIKTENVMIGGFGEVYLLDWGIALDLDGPARDTKGAVVGTPVNMAPEMAEGMHGQVDERTDVYLLGATLHEILTSQPRHGGNTLMHVLFNAARSSPIQYGDDVPEELAAICNTATERQPEARFESALAFRQALDAFLLHRDSATLEEAARIQLDKLITCRQRQQESVERAIEIQRHYSASRFGFEQALALWPANTEAWTGLQLCIKAMLEEALARGELLQAEILIDDLSDPPQALQEAVEALRAKLASESGEVGRLRAELHDRDLNVSRRQRSLATIGIGMALTMGFGVLIALHRLEIFTPGHGAHMALLSTLLGAVLLTMLVGHQVLMPNAGNRRVQGAIVAMIVAALFVAGLSWAAGLSIPTAFAFDYAMVATSLVIMAPLTERWVYVLPLPFGLAAFASILWPGVFLEVGAVGIFLAHVFVALLLVKDAIFKR